MGIKKELGIKIKRMRINRGLTQEQLAEMVDVSQRTMSGIEIGENFVTAETLDKIIPGINNDDTLLYGPEIKFFSNEIETDDKFRLKNANLYFVGDGSGKAGNIVTAAATGLVAARDILRKKEK